MFLLQVHEVTNTEIYGAIFLTICSWIALFLLQWGGMREFKKDVSRRLTILESTVADRILPRKEYENRHEDLQNRVKRLEDTEFLRARRYNRETPG